MPDEKRYTEKTEVTTETDSDSPEFGKSSYKKETTVKTERKVEEDDKPVVIIKNS